MGWYPYELGSTIGGTGSENSLILRDEEYRAWIAEDAGEVLAHRRSSHAWSGVVAVNAQRSQARRSGSKIGLALSKSA